MKTGALNNVGVKLNESVRPTHYLQKHFPIEGRKDFFKWVIVTPEGLAKDYKSEVMYFDSFNLELAKATLRAIKSTARINKEFLN